MPVGQALGQVQVPALGSWQHYLRLCVLGVRWCGVKSLIKVSLEQQLRPGLGETLLDLLRAILTFIHPGCTSLTSRSLAAPERRKGLLAGKKGVQVRSQRGGRNLLDFTQQVRQPCFPAQGPVRFLTLKVG